MVKGFRDERIRYILLDKNTGTSAAPRNTGIKAARGEYIALLDSDDGYLPRKLEKQIKAFENASPKIGVAYTGMWRITNDEKIYWPFRDVIQKEDNVHKEFLKRNFIGAPTVLIKKNALIRLGCLTKKSDILWTWICG